MTYRDQRIFGRAIHEHFSRLSADYNPIHSDPVAARRTHAGCQIVHGIHSLVWALNAFARSPLRSELYRMLKAQFLRPIYLDDTVDLEITRLTHELVRIRLSITGEEVVSVLMGCDGSPRPPPLSWDPQSELTAPPHEPCNRRLEEMPALSGNLAFGPSISEIASLYPDAVSRFGMSRISALVSSSCLVGMVVPGLHSMFSGLEVYLSDDSTPFEGGIQYKVLSVTDRFRLVKIGILGQGIHGVLETINRMPPVKQPSMALALARIRAREFEGSTALIIGGSRGLGELTAKLIGAGGGNVIITYATGSDDAQSVAKEITDGGGRCTVVHYDVRQSASRQLASYGMVPTHLYYFATPSIFKRKNSLFDSDRFGEFSTFYLTGFLKIAQACLELRPQGVIAFYPSSAAIEARSASMTEYTMAKAAGEILCVDMERFMPGLRILTRRLPSLPTDQTSSVVQRATTDSIEVLLPILRELNS